MVNVELSELEEGAVSGIRGKGYRDTGVGSEGSGVKGDKG